MTAISSTPANILANELLATESDQVVPNSTIRS